MGKVKLVAESFSEYTSQIEPVEIEKVNEQEEELNESSKGLLQKFMKNPEKGKTFVAAYGQQTGKKGGDKLKKALLGLDTETKKKLAQQSLDALQDSKKGYAWIKISNGKIVGAGAMGVEGADGLVGSMGRS